MKSMWMFYLDTFDMFINISLTNSLVLAGVGVRVKKIAGPLKVNVYSAALYVEKSKALNSLKLFKQNAWAKLKSSSEFSDIVRYH